MEFAFYFCAFIAIIATLRIVTHTNPMYTLLYLIIFLLAISGIFFSLGAHLVGALEIIIYTGSIMVLFVFIIMLLNLDTSKIKQDYEWLKAKIWIISAILLVIMLVIITCIVLDVNDRVLNRTRIDVKEVGITLFGSYILAIELISMLLLAALISVFHIGREHHVDDRLQNQKNDKAKRSTEGHV